MPLSAAAHIPGVPGRQTGYITVLLRRTRAAKMKNLIIISILGVVAVLAYFGSTASANSHYLLYTIPMYLKLIF